MNSILRNRIKAMSRVVMALLLSMVSVGAYAQEETYTMTRTIAEDEEVATGMDVSMTYTKGQSVTIPYNQSYMKTGYSVTAWKDRSTLNVYHPGDVVTIDHNMVLDAVWTENTHKITDLKGAAGENPTVVFHFLQKDGAPALTAATGILVGQVRFSDAEGDFIDVVCQYETDHSQTCPTDGQVYNGMFNNALSSSAGEYALVQTGTMFKFPAVYGMTVNYKPVNVFSSASSTLQRTYVSYSQLADGTLSNPAFTAAQAATAPVKGAFTDNYSDGGVFSYTGEEETAELTSIESSVTYTGTDGQTLDQVLASGSLAWNNGNGYYESLSVTYPVLYKVEATAKNMSDTEDAASVTITAAPKNTDGKYIKDTPVTVTVTPDYPYVFYYMTKPNPDDVENPIAITPTWNYTRDEETESPTGEYNYADIATNNTYGGSYTFNVTEDETFTANIKKLTTYDIDTDVEPFRSGTVNLPDGRTSFAVNNIITLTTTAKVGYLKSYKDASNKTVSGKWVDGNGNALKGSSKGNVRNVSNTGGTLKLVVNATTANTKFVYQFVTGVEGTLIYDLSSVPEGTITEGFPTSETNTALVIPQYYTLYKSGKRLSTWSWVHDVDGVSTKTNYTPGNNYSFTTNGEVRTVTPNFTNNGANFDYRTTSADVTWDFRTSNYAQKMQFGTDKTVYYSTRVKFNYDENGANAKYADVPLVINTGSKGQLDNTILDDWCTIGEGTTFKIPSGQGAVITLASYSKITSTKIEDDTLTHYKEITDGGVKVYLYTDTIKSTATSVTLTIGDDYSYYKYIRAELPAADKVDVNLLTNNDAMGSVALVYAKVGTKATSADVATTQTETGYNMPLGTYVKISAKRKNLYEFDHWEDGDGNVLGTQVDEDGNKVYTVTKSNTVSDLSNNDAVDATIAFQVTSYVTNIKAVFKLRDQYQIKFASSDVAIGVVPESQVVEHGGSFTMPTSNQTLFYSGHTLKYWQDASSNKYEYGKTYTPAGNLTLYPVFELDEFSLFDIKNGESATVTWNLAKKDGACNLNYHDAVGVYVTQLTYGGKTIDVPLKILSSTATSGFNNTSDEDYCVIDAGVTATVPTTPNCEITLSTYASVATNLTSTVIAGATSTSGTSDADAYAEGLATTVTYKGDDGSQNIEFKGDANCFTTISVKYVYASMTKPTITKIEYGSETMSDEDLETMKSAKTVSGVSITPDDNDELPSLVITCDNGGRTEIVQPTIENPTASVTLRTENGIFVSSYDINFSVNSKSGAPALQIVSINGVEATKVSDFVWEYDGEVSPASGIIQLTFDRKMQAFSQTLKMSGNPVLTLTAESGKTLNCEYFDASSLVYGKTIPVGLSRNLFSDVYGNKCGESGYYTIYVTIASTKTSVNKKAFDFVVTDNVDAAVVKKLKAAGIDCGSLKDAMTKANAKGADNRFYVFVPDGTYDLGSSTFDLEKSNISLIGQSQDKTIIKNGDNMSTLKIGADMIYLQDMTVNHTYEGYVDGSESLASALYDCGYKTIMKNVTAVGYRNTYLSDMTATSDGNGRAYYEDCSFAGMVDVISGDGDVWFEGCNLWLRYRNNENLCAPKSSANNEWGFVFNDCTVDAYDSSDESYTYDEIKDAIDAKTNTFTLGRPWGGSPAATYLNTTLNVFPTDEGWQGYTDNLVVRMREYNSVDENQNVVDLAERSIDALNPGAGSLEPVMYASDAESYTLHAVTSGGEAYNPTTYTAQRPAVSKCGFDDEVMSWTEDAEALCYFIFRSDTEDGEYKLYQITKDATCSFKDVKNPEGWYIVRAANVYGGLGIASIPIEFQATLKYQLKMSRLYFDSDGKKVGWSTICLPYNAKVPVVDTDGDGENDIKVYAACTIKDNTITLKPVDYITAKEGYVTTGTPGTYSFNSSSHTSEDYNNRTSCLNGNPDTLNTVDASYYNCYTLAYKSDVSGIGFYRFNGSTLACNKAWLDVTTYTEMNESSADENTLTNQASKRGILFIIEDDEELPNAVKNVIDENDTETVYDLQGKRVVTPVPGHIYIMGGKKVMWAR